MVLAFTGFHLTVANVPALVLAGVISLFALVSASFAFAPLSVLAGSRRLLQRDHDRWRGVQRLCLSGKRAAGLDAGDRLASTARAMAAIHGAIDGAPFLSIGLDLLFSLLLSGVFLWFTAWLFQKVEYRVRVTGALRGG
ncbi:MAG: hypothetical protein U0556_00070 [Dehalococcoidia bacterium]